MARDTRIPDKARGGTNLALTLRQVDLSAPVTATI
jgi:hypothetical protein